MSVYLYIDTRRNTERERERANLTSQQLINVVRGYVGILISFVQFFCKFKIISK